MAFDPATALTIAGISVPALLDFFGNAGNRSAQNRALEIQSQIAREGMGLQRKQASLDLPFRKNLLSMLAQRQRQRIPAIMPGRVRQVNPMTRRSAARATGSFNHPALQQRANRFQGRPQAQHVNLRGALQRAQTGR